MPERLLFLCTANSARSQIAEGLVRGLWPGWRAFSAGTAPGSRVHPLAVQVLTEWGLDPAGLYPKPVARFEGQTFDWVITVCDAAARACPLWLGPGRRLHWGLPDPAAVRGSPRLQLAAFRVVRNALYLRLSALLGPEEGVRV